MDSVSCLVWRTSKECFQTLQDVYVISQSGKSHAFLTWETHFRRSWFVTGACDVRGIQQNSHWSMSDRLDTFSIPVGAILSTKCLVLLTSAASYKNKDSKYVCVSQAFSQHDKSLCDTKSVFIWSHTTRTHKQARNFSQQFAVTRPVSRSVMCRRDYHCSLKGFDLSD